MKFVNEVKIDSHFLGSGAPTDETNRSPLQLLEVIFNQKIIE
jgi:hypothetical protein